MRNSVLPPLLAAAATLALWALQPIPAAVLDPPPQPVGSVTSLSPQWASYVWIGAAVAFGGALLASRTLRGRPVRPAVRAAVAVAAYILAVLVLTMIAGVTAREMVSLGPALIAFMLIRFHGVIAFTIAFAAAAIDRRDHSVTRNV